MKHYEPLEDRRLLCGAHLEDGPPASPLFAASVTNAPLASGTTASVASAVPVLNSRPGAHAQLVLDFDGDAAGNWNFGGGSYYVPATPAYSVDTNRTAFSQTELNNIRDIWLRVAEKFSPFDVNVTTVDPGTLGDNHVQKVVIGGDGAWLGQDAGGVGTFGGFAGPADNKVYVFSDKSGGNTMVVGEAAAHEAGHGFGIEHQSVYNSSGDKVEEYNGGNDKVSPIMGFNPAAERKMWWSGRNALGINQHDADVIASPRNGFGYRPDDKGVTSSMTVDGAQATASGVLERVGDTDGFLFTINGAESVGIRVTVAPKGPMVDARFEVRSNSNTSYTVFAKADTANINETLSGLKLAAGTYRLVVSSPNAPTGQGFGLGIGGYSVKLLNARTSTPTYAVDAGKTTTLSAAGPSSLTYAWDLDGDGVFGETGTGATRGLESGRNVTFNATGLAAGSQRVVKVRVGDGAITSIATATVVVNNAPAAPSVPSPWTTRDVGNVGATGGATASSGGVFTVTGAGADVQGTADAFHFVSQPLNGDGQIVARVDSLNAANAWAKAGLMIRAGSGINAANAFVFVTPGNGIKMTDRVNTGGTTGTSARVTATAPYWLKLVRQGNVVSGYASSNGSTWQLVNSRTVNLGGTGVLVGLAVTSHDYGKIGTGVFSNVTIGAAAATPNTNVGAKTLAATQDTYVRGGSWASTSFGNEADLFVKHSTAAYTRETYLQFDLSTVSTVGKAVLRLYGRTDSGNVRVDAVAVTGSSAWSESALTYNNRPAAGSVLATTTVNSTAAWHEWDVTSYLQARKAAGDVSVTLLLRGADFTDSVTRFSSSESASGPQLVVT